jgi:hypothetical protein
MAKAKRERRTSIRTMQTDKTLAALDALEEVERRVQAEQQAAGPAEVPAAEEADDPDRP